jgi:hypothetical protein
MVTLINISTMVTTPASYYPSNKYINETQHDEFASYYNRGFTNLNFILDGIIRLVGSAVRMANIGPEYSATGDRAVH